MKLINYFYFHCLQEELNEKLRIFAANFVAIQKIANLAVYTLDFTISLSFFLSLSLSLGIVKYLVEKWRSL